MKSDIKTLSCRHCALPIPDARLEKGDGFCCNGCSSVYRLLNSMGLESYYQIKSQVPTVRPPQAVSETVTPFDFLDDASKAPIQENEDGTLSLEFYLEGVHCAACVWLVEKLPEILPAVLSARLNLSEAIAKITIMPEGSFAEVAQTLADFGYQPHAIASRKAAQEHRRKENHRMLKRIGVAAFSAGNLMILSVALYSGLEGHLAIYFLWLSLILAIPALTYSAWPFYRTALGQLRHGQLSIDVPISLSLIVGGLSGIWFILQGQDGVYYDSLAMLVFLLLTSRYILSRIQESILAQRPFLHFYQDQKIRVKRGESWIELSPDELQSEDLFEVPAGERILADGVIVEGQSALDESLLTGEALPVEVAPGTQVYAGTKNTRQTLLIQAHQVGNQTYLAKILDKTRNNLLNKSRLVNLTDKIARYFVSVVLLASAALVVGGPLMGIEDSFSRALALVIISCPCALALTMPLMMSLSMKRAYQKGFFIKNADAIEGLWEAQSLIFDKTGTLTTGQFTVLSQEGITPEVAQAILALESRSLHPIAKALVRWSKAQFEQSQPLAVQNLKTLPQGGIQADISGTLWEISPQSRQHSGEIAQLLTTLQVKKNGQKVATLALGDQLRTEASQSVQALREQGLQLGLISGDQAQACQYVAQALDIPQEAVFYRATPEDKEVLIAKFPTPIMVGDGANDMIALSKARVGISVQGSMEENLQHSDIHLSQDGVNALPALIQHARQTQGLVYTSLRFSLAYNLIGISAALLGWVTPLYAAILMPLSSLTVMGIAVWGGTKQ